MSADVACPRCPAGPYTEPGRLAGHLVEVHGLGAAVALHEARRLLVPAPVTPAERDAIAKRLGVKPAHPIVSDLLHRAGFIETKPDPKEAKMAKKKRAQQKCRTCGAAGHNAKSCGKTVTAPRLNKHNRTPRGPLRVVASANGAAGAADLIEKAKADARALIKSKIDDELVMARAYLAELERLANA